MWLFFFFFKQKTAYEMRISDWSSDVCSSELVDGQGGGQGLALAGAHLGDLAHVQDHAADQLDIEMAHPEHPHRGFTADREGLRQHLVQRLALGDALAE